jgi:CBS domain-containing protein
MRERGVRRLPVVRPDGALAGVLALDNLLEALVNRHQPPLGAHLVKGRVARFFMHKRCST